MIFDKRFEIQHNNLNHIARYSSLLNQYGLLYNPDYITSAKAAHDSLDVNDVANQYSANYILTNTLYTYEIDILGKTKLDDIYDNCLPYQESIYHIHERIKGIAIDSDHRGVYKPALKRIISKLKKATHLTKSIIGYLNLVEDLYNNMDKYFLSDRKKYVSLTHEVINFYHLSDMENYCVLLNGKKNKGNNTICFTG